MKLLVASASFLVALLAGAPPVLGAEVQRADFRYTRPLAPVGGGGTVVFEPDGPLYAHAHRDFAGLRILDARGEQVAWRRMPQPRTSEPERVSLLNSGRRGGRAVALVDLGGRRTVRDRVVLDIPDRDFIGRAIVLGSDRRRGPFTRLSGTGIYDVGGAQTARSTVAVFPPSDFRYLLLRVSGVSGVSGATVSGAGERPPLIRRWPRSVTRREEGTRTAVTLDLGFRNLPVEELRIEAGAGRYERPVTILASNDRRRFLPLAGARIFRFAGSRSAPIAVGARDRFLRIEIENGDDPPLPGINVSPWSRSRALLLEGGRPRPYSLLYGNPRVGAPSYDFARLPVRGLGLAHTVPGRLGAERLNPSYQPPPDTRSFTARHQGIVMAALALAALALGGVGLLAFRKRE